MVDHVAGPRPDRETLTLPPELEPLEARWAPDGKTILFTARGRSRPAPVAAPGAPARVRAAAAT